MRIAETLESPIKGDDAQASSLGEGHQVSVRPQARRRFAGQSLPGRLQTSGFRKKLNPPISQRIFIHPPRLVGRGTSAPITCRLVKSRKRPICEIRQNTNWISPVASSQRIAARLWTCLSDMSATQTLMSGKKIFDIRISQVERSRLF